MAKTGPKTDWKLTDNTVRKLEQAFATGCSVLESCVYAEITRDTYYRWIKEKPELSDRFARLRLMPILKARKTLMDNLDNPRVAMWYLERKRPEEFSLKHHDCIDNNVIIQIINYEDLKREVYDRSVDKHPLTIK